MVEKKKDHFHERPLQWITSPLQPDEESISSATVSGHTSNRETPTKSLGDISEVEAATRHEQRRPQLRSRQESAPSELFYDLFFAAAFGSFTDAHDIDDSEALNGYIGFFCLLWMTWMNVGLYDVRLARDSVFDRIAKAAQFIIMAGFALVGTKYNLSPYDDVETTTFFRNEAQSLSFILMTSRWILCVQYLSSVWYARKIRDVWLPSLMIAICYAVTASIYLGIAFVLPHHNRTGYDSYIAWFTLAVVEVLVNVGASCYWPFMNFKRTHLVERMSLLTLIILGEGVIVLFDSVTGAFVAGSSLSLLAPPTLAATLFLYFVYMLYFDNLPEEHFGTIVEPIWASLHFPLHLAIVVAAVGSRFFLSFSLATQSLSEPTYPWQNDLLWTLADFPGHDCYYDYGRNEILDGVTVFDYGYTIYDDYEKASSDGYDYIESSGDVNTTAPTPKYDGPCMTEALSQIEPYLAENFTSLNTSVYQLIDDASAAGSSDADVQIMITWVSQIGQYKNAVENVSSLHLAATGALQIANGALTLTFASYDLDPPEVEKTKKDKNIQQSQLYLEALLNLYNFVYCYFFIACGCLLLILGIMVLLSKGKRRSRFGIRSARDEGDEGDQAEHESRRWTVWDYVRWSGFISAGLCMALLTARVKGFLVIEDDCDGESPICLPNGMVYILPTATLVFFAVLVIQHLPFEWVVEKTGVDRICNSFRRMLRF